MKQKCQINRIPVRDFFGKIKELGLLSSDKEKTLQPYQAKIEKNWDQALKAGRTLMEVFSYQNPNTGGEGYLSTWRKTLHSRFGQTIVSNGNPFATLQCITSSIRDSSPAEGFQLCFQGHKRYMNRLFGEKEQTLLEKKIGKGSCGVEEVHFFHLPRQTSSHHSEQILLQKCDPNHYKEALEFLNRFFPFFARTEEFAEDFFLEGINESYQRVGLSRTRTTFLSSLPHSSEPAGIGIVTRGPLGLSPRFLENLCFLFLHPQLPQEQERPVIEKLTSAILQQYEDFPLSFIPLFTNARTKKAILNSGAYFQRSYQQLSITTKGSEKVYQHYLTKFDKLLRKEKQ